MRYKDIAGQKFGRLMAIRVVGKYYEWVVWLCKCECGNEVEVSSNRLQNGEKKSCGCLKEDYYKKDSIKYIKNYQVEGTNIAHLKSTKLNKSNKSGVRGVSKNKKGKWVAQIVFKRKAYNLGSYEKFEDAVAARKKAEEELFKPIIEKYNE